MTQPTEWVSLKEAAKILGAHPTTVRTWADHGEIPTERTPGGHRRFRREDLENWVKSHDTRTLAAGHATEAQVVVQNALGRTRLEIGGGQLYQLPWYRDLKPDAMLELGQLGRQSLDSLRRFLTASDTNLSEAVNIGTRYGHLLRQQGLTLGQAIRGFFTFNDLLFDSIMQIGELNRADRTDAVRRAYSFTQALLLALIEVYER